MTIQEVLEIQELALKVNSTGIRQKKISGNLPTVMKDFYGNAAWLEIRVFENGWSLGERADRRFAFNTNEPLDQEQMIEYREYMEGLMQKVDPASERSTGSGE